jgi:hypothetical protein
MYWIILLNSYMQFDDDNCGVCIYERCLFFVMVIWWMIGDKHVYVLLFVEHVECRLLVVNSYMLILLVILLVNACIKNEGDIGYYIQWWWVVVEHVHSVSYVHAFISCRIFISSLGYYDVMLALWGDGLDVVGVGTACIKKSCLGA